MAKIMVPPEKLEAVSRQFAQARELGAQICGQLSQHIQMLENSWAGTTQQRFYQDFHKARGQMDAFTQTVGSVSTELRSIAVKFKETDTQADTGINKGDHSGQNGSSEGTTSGKKGPDPADIAINSISEANKWRGQLGFAGTAIYSGLASTLVLTKTVEFKKSLRNPTRAVIHNAAWVKGKGNNAFMRNLGKSLNRQFAKPGIVMKGLKGFDRLAGKLQMGKLGLGFNKANSFPQWTRNVIAGVEKGRYGIATRQIPGMIAKKLYPINATMNIVGEGISLAGKWKSGKLTGTDLAVSASNVAIKTAATYGGAVALGAVGGAIGGPVGAAVGAYVGGTVGSWAGGKVAKFAEKGIRWASKLFK
ncbi:WXG100 family type VII secretion target [Paenibacillus polymyxa]|uniref:WXG100 family type VII secretion target n=1 Tax=Paenibacillus polymyxa TaxID=1406 RepID=UPI002379B9E6|nr:WXG100 family type VII secretion target [Paenibacillus polymyxa]WDM20793.1 WXG100 family type VII secretion target [Paenibacillus polymyxa]